MVECLYVCMYVCMYPFLTPTFLFLRLHQPIHLSLAEKCPITLFDGSISLSEKCFCSGNCHNIKASPAYTRKGSESVLHL